MTPVLGVRSAMARFRRMRVAAALVAVVSPAWTSPACAADHGDPPNLVAVGEQLVTSGQPPLAWLDRLKEQGFGAVVYLAPATVPDAVRDEPLSVSRQGLVFVNLPIRWEKPEARDFETFAAVLDALSGRKVLVHCQLNYRASSMVFLYRTLVRGEAAARAYEDVARVWSPMGAWKPFLQEQLAARGIDFEIY